MGQFEDDAKGFAARREDEIAEARQLAALSLTCGMDLRSALEAPRSAMAALIRKLEHAIERERLRGMRRHWSYDLNRHIALKQVLDKLRALSGAKAPHAQRAATGPRRPKTNGARRRR